MLQSRSGGSDNGIHPDERGLVALKGADQRREKSPPSPRSLCGLQIAGIDQRIRIVILTHVPPIADRSPRR